MQYDNFATGFRALLIENRHRKMGGSFLSVSFLQTTEFIQGAAVGELGSWGLKKLQWNESIIRTGKEVEKHMKKPRNCPQPIELRGHHDSTFLEDRFNSGSWGKKPQMTSHLLQFQPFKRRVGFFRGFGPLKLVENGEILATLLGGCKMQQNPQMPWEYGTHLHIYI